MRTLILVLALLMPAAALAADSVSAEDPKAIQQVALDKDQKAPFDGILITEQKAVKTLNLKIDFDKLQKDYEIDRRGWALKESAYQDGMKKLEGQLKDLQPGWWDRNKLEVGVVGGIVVGVAATIAIVYAVDQVRK